MARAEYFLGTRHLGSSEFECQDCTPHSLAYFCPTCGEVWARVLAGPYWSITHAPCEKHLPQGVPDWNYLPGSLCGGYRYRRDDLSKMFWASALEHLPAAVLMRELQLLWKWYDERDCHE